MYRTHSKTNNQCWGWGTEKCEKNTVEMKGGKGGERARGGGRSGGRKNRRMREGKQQQFCTFSGNGISAPINKKPRLGSCGLC